MCKINTWPDTNCNFLWWGIHANVLPILMQEWGHICWGIFCRQNAWFWSLSVWKWTSVWGSLAWGKEAGTWYVHLQERGDTIWSLAKWGTWRSLPATNPSWISLCCQPCQSSQCSQGKCGLLPCEMKFLCKEKPLNKMKSRISKAYHYLHLPLLLTWQKYW